MQKIAICHECGKKRHSRPINTSTKSEKNDDKEGTENENNKAHEKPTRSKIKQKKSVKFEQDTDNEASENNDRKVLQFGFCNVEGQE